MLVPEVLERRLGRMVILIENLSGGGNRDPAVLDQDLQLVLGRFDIFLKSLLLNFQAFPQSPVGALSVCSRYGVCKRRLRR